MTTSPSLITACPPDHQEQHRRRGPARLPRDGQTNWPPLSPGENSIGRSGEFHSGINRHDCAVIVPSLIPKYPGQRVKTGRRDALTLARLHRAGELTAIWVPDPGHEAVRELVRAREAAMADLREKRQHLQSFLLRHGRVFPGRQPWTLVHARWLAKLTFQHPAQYLVLQEYGKAIEDAEARLDRPNQRVADVVATWSMAPCGGSLPSPARRGVAHRCHLCGGDRRRARFDSPQQLMAYLGLVPCESSTGERVRRGRITKAGDPTVRRVLIEGAWTYRSPAGVSRPLQVRLEGLPAVVRGDRLEGAIAAVRAIAD